MNKPRFTSGQWLAPRGGLRRISFGVVEVIEENVEIRDGGAGSRWMKLEPFVPLEEFSRFLMKAAFLLTALLGFASPASAHEVVKGNSACQTAAARMAAPN